jgi:predicted RNA-binding Zn-ribbon protein involved in translation (DUF1610 family)
MEAELFYCPSCGYEDFDIFVAYVRSTANAELYECPECKCESSHIQTREG